MQFDQALWCTRNQLQSRPAKNFQGQPIVYRLSIVELSTDEGPIAELNERPAFRANKGFKQARDRLDPNAMDTCIRAMLVRKSESQKSQD